jgi:hypothetical protein
MFCRAHFRRWLAAVAVALLATPAWAGPGSLVGVYAPAGAGSPRFFAAVFEEEKDSDRRQTAIACTTFLAQNRVTAAESGSWATCPFLVGSQKLMVGCVGPDGGLRFYVTACCHGNNLCVRGYRPEAEAVPEFVPPGRGRDFQMGWDEITIGNFYNTFNIQFRCQTLPHSEGDPE